MVVSEAQLEDSSETPRAQLLQARSLLSEALKLIDTADPNSDMGARIQELIESLEAKLA